MPLSSTSMKTDLEPDDKPCIKSEEDYPDYVTDYDSFRIDEQDNDFEETKRSCSVEKSEMKVVDILEMKTEPTLDTSPVAEADSTSSTATYSMLHRVKDEHFDGVDQVKMEHQLVVEVKSEKPDTEPTVHNTKLENMDTLTLNEEFDIKCEYEDATSDSVQIKKEWEQEQRNPPIKEAKMTFSCYVCNYSSLRKKDLTRHMLRHPKISGLRSCEHCNMTFKKKISLSDHILKKHPEFSGTVSNKIHECMHCAFKTANRSHFISHLERHNTQKSFECTHCTYKTTSTDHLARHVITHTKLTCTMCDALFINKISLDNHILKKHPELTASVTHKIHTCTHCEYKTTSTEHLARHTITHTGTKLTCTKCDASFMKKQSLDNHILQKHPELTASRSFKIHECKYCEYKTTYVHHLTMHMTRHTGAKLTCTKCDASFIRKQSLDNHILQEHPELTASLSFKIHECKDCEYKTTYVHHLTMHMMRHTGAKLTCTKCNASFVKKISLHNHILRQHPELSASVSHRIHECAQCEYKTTHGQHFAKHMMKHTGAKLTCTMCDASFTSKISLTNHFSQKHPEFTASVSTKIHECTHCEYKTTHARYFSSHMMKHTGAKLTCTKCDASFVSKHSLDNHILQKHPEITASVTHKVHKCTHCEYKTTRARDLAEHMMEHSATKLTCAQCDATFKRKESLDNHILQKHPEFAGSVSHKIRECTVRI